MAKLQRFRRRGRAGEGENPAEVAVDDADAAPEDDADPADREDADESVDPEEADAPDDDSEDDDSEDDDPQDDDPEDDDPQDEDEDEDRERAAPAAHPRVRAGGTFSLREWLPVALLQAAHPKQAVVTALAMYGVAWLTGRDARESGTILATVLVGQFVLGWHNDLVDARRDQAHNTPGKPIADDRLSRANAWTALIIGALLLLPLSITTGMVAGMCYLGSVAVAMLGNVLFRTTPLSFWSWAVSFGLLPAYLSYGGWGGQAEGPPPEPVMVVLAGLLGIGVHFARSVWGLVADHDDEWTYLPLRVGLRLGATRLLMVSGLYLVAVVVAFAIAGAQVGLSR